VQKKIAALLAFVFYNVSLLSNNGKS